MVMFQHSFRKFKLSKNNGLLTCNDPGTVHHHIIHVLLPNLLRYHLLIAVKDADVGLLQMKLVFDDRGQIPVMCAEG